MAFWWVNQAQSYERDRAGGYMWAPLRDSAGHALGRREAMTMIRPGDTVFHYAKGAVRAVSTVTSAAEVTPEPARGMDDGNRIGRLVRVEMTDLAAPIRLSTLPLDERLAQPAGPFNVKGGIKRGYLAPITDAFGSVVLARCDAALGRTGATHVTEAATADGASAADTGLWASTRAEALTSTDDERSSATEPAVAPAPRFQFGDVPPVLQPLTPVVPSEPAVRDWLERYAVKVSANAAEADRPSARLRLERRRPVASDRSGELAFCPGAVAHLVHRPPMLYRVIERGDLIRVRLESPTSDIDVLRFMTAGGDHLVASLSPGLRRRLQVQAMSRLPRAIGSLLALRGPSPRIATRKTTSLALKHLERSLGAAAVLDCAAQGEALAALLSEFRSAMLSRYD